jgi:hypothetical protein
MPEGEKRPGWFKRKPEPAPEPEPEPDYEPFEREASGSE